MLQLTNNNGCLNVKLHEYTNTYDKNMIMEYYTNNFNDRTGLLNECIETANATFKNDTPKLEMVNGCLQLVNQNTNKNININHDELYTKNPLWLLSECYACDCGLIRSTQPLFRNFAESKINDIVAQKYSNNNNFTYSTYYPGYFFQDVVILTEMKNKILNDAVVTVNIVGVSHEFVKLIGDRQYAGCNAHYGDDDKGKWIQMYVMRITHMLQWFKGIGMNINLNIYDNYTDYIKLCKIDNTLFSDITVGIDYVDDNLIPKYLFKIFAICTTAHGGDIISLRTDGIPFMRKLQFCFEMCKNNNPNYYINMWEMHKNEIDNLKIELEKHHITESGNMNNKQIVRDGIIYNYECYMYVPNGPWILEYIDDQYKDIEKSIETNIGVMYKHFDDIFNNLEFGYKFEGSYYEFVYNIYHNYVKGCFYYLLGY